jgi:hypothetical protein
MALSSITAFEFGGIIAKLGVMEKIVGGGVVAWISREQVESCS